MSFREHGGTTAVAAAPKKTPGCVAVIVNSRREVLLQLRDDKPGICWPGHWSLPGGGSEPGETPMDTILREIKEETGIVPDTIEEVTVAAYEPGRTPPHVFLGSWEGVESELVVGEGQELRLTAVGNLPERMPPHIRHYVLQLTGQYT
ncbi:NUDIX domain-containing protein [Streptomyces phaeolivaceus]|uniref:NUDIX domain-containing protein n=1 Tax=Streptomyces phaeolivaceus TaxID=2653200 RepID=UPI001D0574AC|nr:NUDIX domain-containing protein [Streptomyces phaeolivaceus]